MTGMAATAKLENKMLGTSINSPGILLVQPFKELHTFPNDDKGSVIPSFITLETQSYISKK